VDEWKLIPCKRAQITFSQFTSPSRISDLCSYFSSRSIFPKSDCELKSHTRLPTFWWNASNWKLPHVIHKKYCFFSSLVCGLLCGITHIRCYMTCQLPTEIMDTFLYKVDGSTDTKTEYFNNVFSLQVYHWSVSTVLTNWMHRQISSIAEIILYSKLLAVVTRCVCLYSFN